MYIHQCWNIIFNLKLLEGPAQTHPNYIATYILITVLSLLFFEHDAQFELFYHLPYTEEIHSIRHTSPS